MVCGVWVFQEYTGGHGESFGVAEDSIKERLGGDIYIGSHLVDRMANTMQYAQSCSMHQVIGPPRDSMARTNWTGHPMSGPVIREYSDHFRSIRSTLPEAKWPLHGSEMVISAQIWQANRREKTGAHETARFS